MFCPKCGSPVLGGTQFCFQCGAPINEVTAPEAVPVVPQPPVQEMPAQRTEMTYQAAPATKKEKKPKKEFKPSPPVRILLRVASVLLSLYLIVSLIATALVIDGQRLRNQDHVEKAVESLLLDDSSREREQTREALAEMIVDELKAKGGSKMTVTKEQVLEFLDESDAEEFMSEKMAGFISDFINDTDETTLRKSEVLEMLEDNERAAEEAFGVELNDTLKQDVANFMEKNDVEKIIRKKVFNKIKDLKFFDDSIGNLLEEYRAMTSAGTLILLMVQNVVIMVLLWLVCWFRLGVAMKRVGVSMTVAGGLLSLPTLLMQLVPSILESIGGRWVAGIIQTLVGVMAPVHYTLLILGVVMIIGGIVVKVHNKVAKD